MCYNADVATNTILRLAALTVTRKRIWKADLAQWCPSETIEEMMQADDDEARAVQIHSYLLRHDHRLLSLSMILRGRCELGWTYRGSAYYQLIHQVNKEKQLE